MNRGVDSKMNDELIYSEQWNVSSKYFYDNVDLGYLYYIHTHKDNHIFISNLGIEH